MFVCRLLRSNAIIKETSMLFIVKIIELFGIYFILLLFFCAFSHFIVMLSRKETCLLIIKYKSEPIVITHCNAVNVYFEWVVYFFFLI